jgi:hypothetical protein
MGRVGRGRMGRFNVPESDIRFEVFRGYGAAAQEA